MQIVFYLAAIVAILSTILAVTRSNAVHALLYLIVSFLASAVVFFVLGAHFVAALEVIVYAGAIMVLFVFVIMMLNVGSETENVKNKWLRLKAWIGPAILALVLFVELAYVILTKDIAPTTEAIVAPKVVGISLFTEYLLGIEIGAVMLMSGIIGAYHLAQIKKKSRHRFLGGEE